MRTSEFTPETMRINTTFLRRCLRILEVALAELSELTEGDGFRYDIYRSACVKQFELVLELSGKLLRRRLATYFGSQRRADGLVFKDLFRHGARHGLLTPESAERWFRYRDNRNTTAYDYGERFAEETLKLLPTFVEDARALADAIDLANDV